MSSPLLLKLGASFDKQIYRRARRLQASSTTHVCCTHLPNTRLAAQIGRTYNVTAKTVVDEKVDLTRLELWLCRVSSVSLVVRCQEQGIQSLDK